MDVETARAAARFVWEHRDQEYHLLAVHFVGGEPFLGREAMFEIMRRLVRFVGGTGCRLHFSIDTNGTLLDESSLRFLDQVGGVQINVSVDGSRSATDALRRGPRGGRVWERVMRNIRRAKKYAGIYLGVSAVLTKENCDASAVLATLRRMGFRHITLTEAWPSPLNQGSGRVEISEREETVFLHSMVEALTGYFRDLVGAMREGRPPDYFLANVATVLRAAQPPRENGCARRCTGGAPAIDIDGSLLPCAAMAHLPALKIGHIQRGLDEFAARNFQQARLSITEVEKCRHCENRLRCGGPCLQFVCPEEDLRNVTPADAYCSLRKRETRLGWMALESLRREYGSGLPALLDYARDWYGAAAVPVGIIAGSVRRSG
jgi:uncharacterized protein